MIFVKDTCRRWKKHAPYTFEPTNDMWDGGGGDLIVEMMSERKTYLPDGVTQHTYLCIGPLSACLPTIFRNST